MSKSDQRAVALKYNADQDMAPVVIASGYGHVAEKIIDVAEQRGIPVYRDDSASSLLCMLEVGASIPEELYQVVATIYAEILSVAARARAGSGGGEGSTHAKEIRRDGPAEGQPEAAAGQAGETRGA